MPAPRLPFDDRAQAGRLLAEAVVAALPPHAHPHRAVLALPRGGVPVAVPVAHAWRAPLDLLLVRKLGTPGHEELALGAIADAGPPTIPERGGRDAPARASDDPAERATDAHDAAHVVVVRNDDLIRQLRVSPEALAAAERRAREELRRRSGILRGDRGRVDPRGATVVLVDDGVATGATIRAGLRAVRAAGAARTIVATPVAPPDVIVQLRGLADEVIVLAAPEPFTAVGAHYRAFPQVTDDAVVRALQRFDAEARDVPREGGV